MTDTNDSIPEGWENAYPTLADDALDATNDDLNETELAKLDQQALADESAFDTDDAPQPHAVTIRTPQELAAASNEAKRQRDAQAAAASFDDDEDPFEALAAEVDEGAFLKTGADESTTKDEGKAKRRRRAAKRKREPQAPLLERARRGIDRDRGTGLADKSFYARDFKDTNAGLAVSAATTTGELMYGVILQAIATIIAYPMLRAGVWLKHWGREPVLKSEYSQLVLGGKGILRLYGKWCTMLGDMLGRTVERVKAQRRLTLQANNLQGLDARGVVRTIREAIPEATTAKPKTDASIEAKVERIATSGYTEEDKQLLDVANELDPTKGTEIELVAAGTPFDMGEHDEESSTPSTNALDGREPKANTHEQISEETIEQELGITDTTPTTHEPVGAKRDDEADTASKNETAQGNGDHEEPRPPAPDLIQLAGRGAEPKRGDAPLPSPAGTSPEPNPFELPDLEPASESVATSDETTGAEQVKEAGGGTGQAVQGVDATNATSVEHAEESAPIVFHRRPVRRRHAA